MFSRKVAGIVSIIALMAAMPAMAQQSSSSDATSNAGAASQSSSGSAARSQSGTQQFRANTTTSTGVTVDQRSYGAPSGTAYTNNQNYTGGTNNYSTERSTGDVTVRTTPTVYAPPVSGGNPCTLAVSGGVSVIGWGAAAGGTFVDEDCATRQKIAMIHNSGRPDVAFELMCNDRATYNAAKLTGGQKCAYRSQFEAPGAPAPMVQQAPTPVTYTPPPAQVAPAPVAGRNTLPRCKGPNDQGPCFSG